MKPSSATNLSKYTASLAASDAAMISHSQEERAMDGCFLDPHEIAAFDIENTKPEVECLTAQSADQSASDIPDNGD